MFESKQWTNKKCDKDTRYMNIKWLTNSVDKSNRHRIAYVEWSWSRAEQLCRLKPRWPQAAAAGSLPHHVRHCTTKGQQFRRNHILNLAFTSSLSLEVPKFERKKMPYALKGRNVLITGGSRYVQCTPSALQIPTAGQRDFGMSTAVDPHLRIRNSFNKCNILQFVQLFGNRTFLLC